MTREQMIEVLKAAESALAARGVELNEVTRALARLRQRSIVRVTGGPRMPTYWRD